MSHRAFLVLGFLFLAPALAVLGAPGRAVAIVAGPNPVELTQPDGSKVTLLIRGDEWQNWLEDTRGYTVVRDGAYRYAATGADGSLVATPFEVGKADPAALGLTKGLRPPETPHPARPQAFLRRPRLSPQLPSRSSDIVCPDVNCVVILAKYSDHTIPGNGYAPARYDTLFDVTGGSPASSPAGCVREYYREVSYNGFTIHPTVVGWVTLPGSEASYASAPNSMLVDALQYSNGLVPYADFDCNGDHVADLVVVVHSGTGREATGNANEIWSYETTIDWDSQDQAGDGSSIHVRNICTVPALYQGQLMTHIGVVVHEMGHQLGLPDLYDTGIKLGTTGLGTWDLMANSWGWDNDQLYPPHFSAWSKIQLGFGPETVMTGTGPFEIALPQAETSSAVLLGIHEKYPSGEYLLVENRQPVGYDQQIPTGGIAIYHVDEAKADNNDEGYPGQTGWPQNNSHYRVAILGADGQYDIDQGVNGGDASDLYRDGGVAVINESTVPNTDRYQGGTVYPTGNEVAVLSPSGPSMTVRWRPSTYVDFAYGGVEAGTYPQPFHTVTGGANAAKLDSYVKIKAGATAEAPTIDKLLWLVPYGGVVTLGQ